MKFPPTFKLRELRVNEKTASLLFFIIVAGLFLATYIQFWVLPNQNGVPGWAGWFDQSKYYQSAQALTVLNFDPNLHFYPLGYQILAAFPVALFGHHGYGVLNFILFLITAYCLLKLANSLMPYGASIVSILFLLFYDQQIIFVLVTPWTNNAVLAVYAIFVLFFIKDFYKIFDLIILGLAGGYLFFCRPGDIVILLPIYIYLFLYLLNKKNWIGILFGLLSSIIFPIIFIIMQIKIYGEIFSPYMKHASDFTFEFAGLWEKLFSILVDGNVAFFTSDLMILERFPWMVLLPSALFLLVIEKKWKWVAIQISAVICFFYFVSFAPVMPPTLRIFEGMRLFILPLLLMGIPCFYFLVCAVYFLKKWMLGCIIISYLFLGSGIYGFWGLRQVPVELDINSVSAKEFIHFQAKSSDGSSFKFKQIILPNLTASVLSAAQSDQTIRIEDDNGCFTSQKTHFGLSRPFGVALPLVAPRTSKVVNITVDRKLIDNNNLVLNPVFGITEFCIFCGEKFKTTQLVDVNKNDNLEGLSFNARQAKYIKKFLTRGWSNTENTHIWSNGPDAEITLPPTQGDYDLYMHLDANTLGRQNIKLTLNGVPLAPLLVEGKGFVDVSIFLPHNLLKKNENNVINLNLPDSRSPKELGMSGDARILGIALRDVKITKNSFLPPRDSVTINFAGSVPTEYIGSGWSTTEATHTWTLGNRAEIILPPLHKRSLAMQIEAGTPFGLSQRVEVILNGYKVGTFTATDPTYKLYSLNLPGSYLKDDGLNKVSLLLPDAISPINFGHSDKRILGLAIKALRIGAHNADSIPDDLILYEAKNEGGANYKNEYPIKINLPKKINSEYLIIYFHSINKNQSEKIYLKNNENTISEWSIGCHGESVRFYKLPKNLEQKQIDLIATLGINVTRISLAPQK
jgi:hypothetical protein